MMFSDGGSSADSLSLVIAIVTDSFLNNCLTKVQLVIKEG